MLLTGDADRRVFTREKLGGIPPSLICPKDDKLKTEEINKNKSCFLIIVFKVFVYYLFYPLIEEHIYLHLPCLQAH